MAQPHTTFVGKIICAVVEVGSRKLTYDMLRRRMQDSGKRIDANFAVAPDTPANCRQAGHVIGIERWGQRRLRTLLGEPPVSDEYDVYRPGENMSMAALRDDFASTRAGTLTLIDSLRQANVPAAATAPHNDLGDLSARGWLFYLDSHATREASRVR
jgi:hypothetical protein